MKPREIAIIGGEAIAVYADRHQFELRTTSERIATGPAIAWMYGPFRFVAGRFLVATIGGIAESGFRVFDVVARAWLHEPIDLGNEIHIVGVHPTEPRIALGYDDAIHFWDVATQRHEGLIDESLIPGFVNQVAWHPGEPVLAAGGYQQLSLISTIGEVERVVPRAHYGDVDEVRWVSETMLATSGITEVKLWDRADLALRHTIDLKGARSRALVAAPGTLCVPCVDGSARVIALDTLDMRVEPDVGAAVFDGSQLVVAGTSGIRRV